jgi:hypothetical protein
MKPFIIRVYPDEEMQKELKARLEKAIEQVKEVINNYQEYEL